MYQASKLLNPSCNVILIYQGGDRTELKETPDIRQPVRINELKAASAHDDTCSSCTRDSDLDSLSSDLSASCIDSGSISGVGAATASPLHVASGAEASGSMSQAER